MRKSASDIWRPGYFLQGRLTFNRRRRAAVIDGRGGDLIRLIEGLAALVAENGRCWRRASSARACSTGTPFAFTSAASQGGSRTLRWQERGVDALRIRSHRHPQTTLNQIGRSIPPHSGCSCTTRVVVRKAPQVRGAVSDNSVPTLNVVVKRRSRPSRSAQASLNSAPGGGSQVSGIKEFGMPLLCI
jgi:hypothetical protein